MLLMAAAPLTVSKAAAGERGYAVIRKAPWLLIPLAVGLVIAAQRQDIARYLKIKQMSAGGGIRRTSRREDHSPIRSRVGARTMAPETSILPAGEAQRAGNNGEDYRPRPGYSASESRIMSRLNGPR